MGRGRRMVGMGSGREEQEEGRGGSLQSGCKANVEKRKR